MSKRNLFTLTFVILTLWLNIFVILAQGGAAGAGTPGFSFSQDSFVQAIKDLSLILIITLVFCVFLLGSGWYIDRRALKRQLKHVIRPERDEYIFQWRTNFWQGLSTEFIGAAMTAFLFGIILLIFQQYQSIENEKADLILQMGSPDNAFAIEAVRIARDKGWIFDGTLSGASMNGADLTGASLNGANLTGVYLSEAQLDDAFLNGVNLSGASLLNASLTGASLHSVDLREASLSGADLTGASLNGANLTGAYLSEAQLVEATLHAVNLTEAFLNNADLTGASLNGANLTGASLNGARLIGSSLHAADLTGVSLNGANLTGASLNGANLTGASLRGVDLSGVSLNSANLENVIWIHDDEWQFAVLPDGNYWTPDTDMGKFTDHNHPDYQSTLQKINAIRVEMGIDPIIP